MHTYTYIDGIQYTESTWALRQADELKKKKKIKCSVTHTMQAFSCPALVPMRCTCVLSQDGIMADFHSSCSISQYLKGTTSYVCNWSTIRGTQRATESLRGGEDTSPSLKEGRCLWLHFKSVDTDETLRRSEEGLEILITLSLLPCCSKSLMLSALNVW